MSKTKNVKVKPDMVKVSSSNIKSIGYDGDLYIKFFNGAMWSYAKVPQKIYGELMAADSIGGYFSKNIKPKYKAKQHATEDKD